MALVGIPRTDPGGVVKGSPVSSTAATAVDWINVVTQYGAVAGADSTTAIQNALTAAAATGGVVYVPAGTYFIQVASSSIGLAQTPGLKISSNVTLCGDGSASVLKAIAGTNGQQVYDILTNVSSVYNSAGAAPSSSDHNITVRDIAFDGNKAAHVAPHANSDGTAHCIYFSRVKDCQIVNCYSTAPYSDSFVYEFAINNLIADSQSESGRKAGFYSSGCDSTAITGCQSYNDGEGIVLAASWYSTVTGCTVKGWGSFGAGGGIELTADSRYCAVTGNTVSGGSGGSLGAIIVYSRQVGASPVLRGITYGGAADPSTTFPYGARYNTISGNTVVNNGGLGIFLSDYADGNVVSGNLVAEQNSNVGIYLQGAQRNIVEYNRVINNLNFGIQAVSAAANRLCAYNVIRRNYVADEKVNEFTTLTGTGTTNFTTTLTGVGTLFTTEIAPVGAVSPPIPIFIAGESTYNYVTNVASNTSLTLQTAAGTNTAGHALTAPKLANQITQPAATQTNAFSEQPTNCDFNEWYENTGNGAVTLQGVTTKIYSMSPGKISANADVTTPTGSTADTDIPNATTGTFTALRTGVMIVEAFFNAVLASGGGLGNFLVTKCRVSTNGGAFATVNPTTASNNEAYRNYVAQSWNVPVTAGSTYVVKLTCNNFLAVASTWTVFGSNGETGFTYRFN